MDRPYILSFFAQNPNQKHLAHLENEAKHIKEFWEKYRSYPNEHISVEYVHFAQSNRTDLVNKITDYKSKISVIHFSGHAGSEKIFLADGEGDAQGLSELIGENINNLKLVFLNGCATHDQVDFLLSNGVNSVIATNCPVEDKMATEFSSVFYRELSKKGISIKSAFVSAISSTKFFGLLNQDYDSSVVVRGALNTTNKNDDKNLWQLLVNEEKKEIIDDPYWWINWPKVLTKPANKKIPKLFFLVENEARDYYNDLIKKCFLKEIDKNNIAINATFDKPGILEPIPYIKSEISAADTIFFLLNDDGFNTFWKKLELSEKDFENKTIVFVKLDQSDYSIDKLIESGLINFSLIPEEGWGTFKNVPEINKRLVFEKAYGYLIKDYTNKLNHLKDFNFNLQKEGVLRILGSTKNNISYTYIIGSENCGQKLLIDKMEAILGGTTIRKKISFSPSINKIANYLDLIDLIKIELHFENDFFEDIINDDKEKKEKKEKQENLIIIFDWVDKSQLSLICDFWRKCNTELLGKLEKKIIFIALNYDQNQPHILSEKFDTLLPNVAPNTPIKNVDYVDVYNWKVGNSNLDSLDVEKLENIWPKPLKNALFEIGRQMKIPNVELINLLND